MTALILLVEDNPQDVVIDRLAMQDCEIDHRLEVAQDGEQALEILRSIETPDLIILDINLPGMSGIELLRHIRAIPELVTTPVIVMSNSQREEDVDRAYRATCNAFIQKPMGYDKILRNFKAIKEFWFKVATLPSYKNQPPDSTRQE